MTVGSLRDECTDNEWWPADTGDAITRLVEICDGEADDDQPAEELTATELTLCNGALEQVKQHCATADTEKGEHCRVPTCRKAMDRLGSSEMRKCGKGAGWAPEMRQAIRRVVQSCDGIEVDEHAKVRRASTTRGASLSCVCWHQPGPRARAPGVLPALIGGLWRSTQEERSGEG